MYEIKMADLACTWKQTGRQNKPGTAQIGAISKAQKEQKEFKVSSILFYSTRMRKKLKKYSKFFLNFGPR